MNATTTGEGRGSGATGSGTGEATRGGGPLAGLKVLDASQGAVGPWAGALLGLLGADVVKLESPEGDFIHMVRPTKAGLCTTYTAMNINKRGVVLDLKKPDERAVAHRLAAQADVFIENFRPGVADRIGVGWAELSALNPRLVYASACGFGRTGPMAPIGATDPHVQAFSGATSVIGERGGLREHWRWYGHFDCTTAMCITQGVLAALIQRETTGRGQRVSVTMLQAAFSLMRLRMGEHLEGGRPEPMGSATSYLVPDQAFRTQNGWITVSATSRRQWAGLCEAIGRPELRDDPRFATNPLRVEHRDTLVPILEGVFAARFVNHWLTELKRRHVPCAMFMSYDTFRHHLHYLRNDMLRRFETERLGVVATGGMPWRFSATPGEVFLGPRPGEHTARFADGAWPARVPAPDGGSL